VHYLSFLFAICLTWIFTLEKVSAEAAIVDSGKSKQKKRVKKDKNAPKKPMSPFFCYQAVRRAGLKAEQPTLNNTDIIKVSKLTTNALKLSRDDFHRLLTECH
jgi:hypothetical protein